MRGPKAGSSARAARAPKALSHPSSLPGYSASSCIRFLSSRLDEALCVCNDYAHFCLLHKARGMMWQLRKSALCVFYQLSSYTAKCRGVTGHNYAHCGFLCEMHVSLKVIMNMVFMLYLGATVSGKYSCVFLFLRKVGNNFSLQIPVCSSRLQRPEDIEPLPRFPRGTRRVTKTWFFLL